MTISVPNLSPALVPAWIHAVSKDLVSGARHVDLKGLQFISPGAVAALAACLAEAVRGGNQASLLLDDAITAPIQYLQRVDFFHLFPAGLEERFRRHDPQGRFVTLRAITDLKAARQIADETGDFLEAQLSDVAPSVHRGLRFVFEEIAANAVQHSGNPQTAFGLAQGFPKAGRIQIAFADCGLGFRQSLQRNPELQGRVDSEAEAIQLAVEEGVSGTPGRRNMGFGLYALRNLIDRLGGDVWIHSGDALWHRRTVAGKRIARTTPAPLRTGCWICIDTPVVPL